ncbi:MAG: hypothetical protein ACE5G3_10030, partial [Gammaproteobacteria bacterium]
MGQVGDSRLRSFLFAWLVLPALLHWGIAAGAQDHAGHNSAARTMSHGDHQMTPEMISVMRERIPRYRELSDQEIALNMKMMEGNKSRYLSPDKMHADAGLLVLIHGFGETGDRIMREAVQPMAGIFPAAMSAGMSMMDSAHIQKSVDDLENA